ncbi:MAG: ChbG/HpnK family deacetylase [Candidatus Paceibacterota bacterium]|nr:MAG: ChbG/HpnK family deacetylase [Candidatus Paceibacterota bacterium]
MKKIIINADDFGYSKSIDEGILETIKNGVVRSTSVMVYGKAVEDITNLIDVEKNISIGLHLHMEKTLENPQIEFSNQIEIFTKLFGKIPDHIDIHKPRSSNLEQLIPLLEQYSAVHNVPVRELGHAKSIKSFFGINVKNDNGIDPNRVSVESLLDILERLDEGISEIMTHPGYSNDELRNMTSYNDTRELELRTLTDRRIIEYFDKNHDVQLINWKEIL